MRRKLLLADDSLTIQRVMTMTFADEPVDVETVSDGLAAIARLDAAPPDLVLADIGMPGGDGYEVAMHVRRTPALAHIPVILLTGAFDPVDHARAREAGCVGVVVKPFDPQMLVARVRQLLGPGAAAATPTVGPAVREPEPPVATSSSAALPAPAEAAQGSGRRDLDDYFERLDRAFANLGAAHDDGPCLDVPTRDGTVEPATPVILDHEAERHTSRDPAVGSAVEGALSASIAGADVRATTTPSVTAAPTLSGAFAALLAIEQGEPLPRAAEAWAIMAANTDAVEQIVRRMTQEIADAVVRELAPDILSQVAERLVRDEIARLRTFTTAESR